MQMTNSFDLPNVKYTPGIASNILAGLGVCLSDPDTHEMLPPEEWPSGLEIVGYMAYNFQVPAIATVETLSMLDNLGMIEFTQTQIKPKDGKAGEAFIEWLQWSAAETQKEMAKRATAEANAKRGRAHPLGLAVDPKAN